MDHLRTGVVLAAAVLTSSLVVFGCATGGANSVGAPPPPGIYAGTIRAPWGTDLAILEIDPTRTPAVSIADPRSGEESGTAPANLQFEDREISFDRTSDRRTVTCRASIENGVVLTANDSAACTVRLVRIDPAVDISGILGLYRAEDGRMIDVSRAPELPLALLTDYDRATWRALSARDGATFTFGPGLIDPAPVAGVLSLEGSADGGSLGYASEPPSRLTRVELEERPVSWRNGDAQLHGTLILPETQAPFPAVILTQASGATDRNSYRETAHWFVSRGVAALIYDRRGVGESTGDTRETGFPELAEDAARAAAELEKIPEIDARRIGVWGQSQGGWIAPLAAARSSDISWVIAQSGPAVTASEQEIYRAAHQPRAEGYTEGEIAEVMAYAELVDRWRRFGEGRDELVALAKESKEKRWASIMTLVDDTLPERVPEARLEKFWLYDPLPEYRKITVPILVLYGDRDVYVPVDRSAELWRSALAGSGNRNGSVVILRDATHGFWFGESDSFPALTRSPGYHPSYWPTLERFLRQNVLSAEERERLDQQGSATQEALPKEAPPFP